MGGAPPQTKVERSACNKTHSAYDKIMNSLEYEECNINSKGYYLWIIHPIDCLFIG